MKLLNEKTIAHFSKLIKPSKKGYLHKRGNAYTHAFKRRYFVLTGNVLSYYENQTQYSNDNGSPIGVIFLEGHTVGIISDNDFPFTFTIQFPAEVTEMDSRAYILAAESNGDMEDWMTAAVRATFDWTRISVDDIEEKLSVLNSTTQLQLENSNMTPMFESNHSAAPVTPRRNPFNDSTPAMSERIQSPKVQSCLEMISSMSHPNDRACSLNTEFLRMTFEDMHASAGLFWNDSDSKQSIPDDSSNSIVSNKSDAK